MSITSEPGYWWNGVGPVKPSPWTFTVGLMGEKDRRIKELEQQVASLKSVIEELEAVLKKEVGK